MSYALITGASSGLGVEFAELFAASKVDLILTARNEEKLNELKERLIKAYGVKVILLPLDLSQKTSADELYHAIDKLTGVFTVEYLVNNAGFGDAVEYVSSAWDRQDEMLELNVRAVMRLCHLFGAVFKKEKRGKILNVASIASLCAGPYMATYYATKSFVLSFTQAIREELKPFGVGVTALCPGPTATGFEKNAMLTNSNMFKKMRVATANKVARCGYNALIKNKAIAFSSASGFWLNLATRLFPRAMVRSVTKRINKPTTER